MSSKRRLRRNACGDKQRHADRTQAVRHLIELKRKGAVSIRTYMCRFCHGWHVGHYK